MKRDERLQNRIILDKVWRQEHEIEFFYGEDAMRGLFYNLVCDGDKREECDMRMERSIYIMFHIHTFLVTHI